MEPADSRQPSNVFSPAEQYHQAHTQLSTGAHHMLLKAIENELYEREVACFIEGIKVGILHDDEGYDYYRPIRQLNEHDMELVVPCLVTENSMIYYRPVPRESLQKWVAGQLPQTPVVVAPEAAEEVIEEVVTDGVDEVIAISPEEIARVSARVSRSILKLVSQTWFSPLDMGLMERFAYGLYWHEANTVDGVLGVQQSNALVLVTYALHRTSASQVVYDKTVMVCGEEVAVIAIEDLDLIDRIISASESGEALAQEIMNGGSIEAPVVESDKTSSTHVTKGEAPSTIVFAFARTREEVSVRRNEVRRLVDEGFLVREIANHMGVTESTVRNDLNALGISPRQILEGRTRNTLQHSRLF